MKIVWTTEAINNYYNTLDYWDMHNGSNTYSNKIIEAVELLVQELIEDPYFLARYDEKLNLYRKTILKGKFLVYYEIKEIENIIEIQYFRSNYQKPLTDN